jgi:hypothetical protein
MRGTINEISYGELERILDHLGAALEIRWQNQLQAQTLIHRIKLDLEANDQTAIERMKAA